MKKTFWDRTAKIYDRFMRKDHAAYRQMYALICPVVRHRQVLELATGTGLIARNILRSADHIEATDASPEMIEQAKQGVQPTRLHFSVQDMFHLPYADQSFDAVIVSNALHIVPEPKKALAEIRRVLKDDGVLIAPTFTHDGTDVFDNIKAFFMKLVGFRQYSKWSSESYLDFLRKQGWTVQKSEVLKASFPLTYAECRKAGHEILPREDKNFETAAYRKTCLRFFKLMCVTSLGKICASDHAMNAVGEMNALNRDIKKFFKHTGAEYPTWQALEQECGQYLGRKE